MVGRKDLVFRKLTLSFSQCAVPPLLKVCPLFIIRATKLGLRPAEIISAVSMVPDFSSMLSSLISKAVPRFQTFQLRHSEIKPKRKQLSSKGRSPGVTGITENVLDLVNRSGLRLLSRFRSCVLFRPAKLPFLLSCIRCFFFLTAHALQTFTVHKHSCFRPAIEQV